MLYGCGRPMRGESARNSKIIRFICRRNVVCARVFSAIFCSLPLLILLQSILGGCLHSSIAMHVPGHVIYCVLLLNKMRLIYFECVAVQRNIKH